MTSSATTTTGTTTATAVLPPVLSPLEFCARAPCRPAWSVLDGLLPAEATPLLVGFAGAALGVMVDVMTMTAGVSPALVGVGVMMMVCTWVVGGADEAITVDVVSLLTGAFEDAGGAAEDCAGGGAALDVVGGAADDAGGGFDDWGGAWVEGDGAGDDGGSAEEGELDCGAAGEEGAGVAVSAGGVTDGTGADEAGGGEGAEGADCAAGLEGATMRESNVLAVPLLAILTTIATRNAQQKWGARKAARRQGHTARAEKQRLRSTTTVSGRELLVSRNAAVSVLGGRFDVASGHSA
jgi:hypothetical protein